MKTLNNLVTELAVLDGLAGKQNRELVIENPREGWVWLRSTAKITGESGVKISLTDSGSDGSVIVHNRSGAEAQESMRYLEAGRHTLRLDIDAGAELTRLSVRAVPELVFCKFQYDPHVAAYGPYDWTFLEKHVLANVNTIVGSGSDAHRRHVEQWKENGGRWIVEVYGKPYFEVWDAKRAYDYWIETPGMANPLLDGIIVDEFSGGEDKRYPAMSDSVRRLKENRDLAGKVYYPYCTSMYGARKSEDFIRTCIDCGYRFAWERYLPEQPTEKAAAEVLEDHLVASMRKWNKSLPGCAGRMIACLGYMDITESLNTNPGVDYKVWMDMQFRCLATDPAFRGLYGLMEYTSGYACRETVTWAARLYRHYGIEGNTDLLSDRLGFEYRLEHIANPDFAGNLDGWTVQPSEEGSVAAKKLTGYSWLQGRYPPTQQGDTFLWMKRSAAKPNVVSQKIKGLRAGQLYSLKTITADYQELTRGLSAPRKQVVAVRIDGVELVPEQSFVSVIPNNYAHKMGRFNRENQAWFNYRQVIFRAKSPTAALSISDWKTETEAGGPVGQELIHNFIEVQPYWSPEE